MKKCDERRGKEMIKKIVGTMLKETLIQMIISVILIAVAAFVVLKISPSDAVIKVIILAIYAISAFAGGFIMGKVMETRKFLWGMAAGAVYIGIILLVAFIEKGSLNAGTVGVASGIITSLTGGTIGGMLS